MWKDHIVEEVRKVREEHAAKFNFDVRAVVEDARKRQHTSRHKVVSFVPKIDSRGLRESSPSAFQ